MVNYTSQKMISMVSLITRKTPKYIQGHNLSDNRVIVNSGGVDLHESNAWRFAPIRYWSL